MIVSGVPEQVSNHAFEIMGMAIDILTLISTIRNPVSGGSLKIRIGKEKVVKFFFFYKLFYFQEFTPVLLYQV